MFKNQVHYAIVRLDGAVMYDSIRAGLMKTGITQSPIVHFKVRAGVQHHPVWAIDELAVEIFSYCQVARASNVSLTHLQASITAMPVSGDLYSNLVATNIEWHIASQRLREQALRVYSEAIQHKKKYPSDWPAEIMSIPVINGS
ncbi:MAG TPA: hypothetical protein VNK49_08905 [Anaerolineales bacterium]|nr:hypothetical protein [Anaerolineales bacterium]